jgi:long-chain acyl-CoA synthetase
MFVRMLKLPREVRSKYDVSSLETRGPRRRPCPVPVKKADDRVVGPDHPRVLRGTEGNGFTLLQLPRSGSPTRAPSARPLLGESAHLDDDGDECRPASPAPIYFEQRPAQFEYHNDPEKTKGSRDPKGWSTLGDVGYLDDDGYLYLTDRKAFMIISGGVNIYPQEAENVLVTHPKVADVAVFGVPTRTSARR